MVAPTLEDLLEDWRDGKYISVADVLNQMPPKHVAKFCSMLVRYDGVNQLVFLDKLLN